jgi:Mrp family chromosome partitioning ATPase
MTAQPQKQDNDFRENFWSLCHTETFQMEMDKLWAAIHSQLSDDKEKSFMICSSSLGEGNTTVTVGLANFVALNTGKGVLIVDAHCKGTTPGDLWDSEVLVPLIEEPPDQYSLTFDEYRTSVPNLKFLSFRNANALETTVVNSQEMTSLMDVVSRRYDYIFVDAPPLLDSNVGAFLAHYLDRIIVVIAASHRPIPILREALTRLDASRDRILGAVINRREYPLPGYIYRLFR